VPEIALVPRNCLDPVMPLVTSIGGSDAQDDLFRQAYLLSLRAAGREVEATAYFKAMTASKRLTPSYASELTLSECICSLS
jgi:hypothetical protein